MKTIAVIPARGGSKRIERKNIKPFMGKPILAYAVEACLSADIFDEVMVSTDDSEISEIAKTYGAKVPFRRSKKTSDDFSTTNDVLLEVISEYRKIGKIFDTICCVYPCVPFLTSEILKESYKRFAMNDCDALMPVVKYPSPIQRAFRVNIDGFLEFREPENALKRSQDFEAMYYGVGMFYFKKVDEFIKNNGLSKRISYVEMNEMQVHDIDNYRDWEIAELKYRFFYGV
jgi:N-acylneuraminate cytidylyltransferase